jgi:hypothetical protein
MSFAKMRPLASNVAAIVIATKEGCPVDNVADD